MSFFSDALERVRKDETAGDVHIDGAMGGKPKKKTPFAEALAKADDAEPRWPKGSPLGGQWMSMGEDGLALVPKIGSAANPGFMKKGEALLAAAKDGDKATLDKFLEASAGKGHHEPIGAGANSQSKWSKQLHQYAAKLKEQVEEKEKAPTGGPLKLSSMKLVGSKPGGSAAGGLYQDSNGQRWIVKGYGNSDQAKSEVLASHLYAAAGAHVPHMELVDLGGQHKGGLGVASKLLDEKFHNVNPGALAEKHAGQQDFAADAWLANWDAVGLNHDNLVITESGKAVRIDPGGSLGFKAMGGLKGAAFGTHVGELHSLRDQAVNASSHSVFGSMTSSQIKESAAKVLGVSDDTILDLVNQYGPGTEAEKELLAEKLMDRKTSLASQVLEMEHSPAKTLAAAPDFQAHKLADTNTNAPSHNKKVDQIAALHAAGDTAGLQAMSFGSNTYGKKQQQLAHDAMASLGHEPAKVPAGAKLIVAAPKPTVKDVPAAPKAVAKPKAPVLDLSTQPKPHDFANFSGPGKGLSTKPWKNAASQATEAETSTLGASGNLAALEAQQYEVKNAEGGSTGIMKPVSAHGNVHVAAHHAATVQWLKEQQNPPTPPSEGLVARIGEISKLFPPKAFATNPIQAAKGEKLGFWYKLGEAPDHQRLAAKVQMPVAESTKVKAYEDFHKLSANAKRFIHGIQSSTFFATAYREGKTTWKDGQKLSDLAEAAHKESVALPAGTVIHRWQQMEPKMVQAMAEAKPGSIIQATGPMSASWHPTDTKHFGTHKIDIEFAPGARGMMSFGSGNYQSEKEISTLPNARFVLMSSKLDETGKQIHVKLLMLPPEIPST